MHPVPVTRLQLTEVCRPKRALPHLDAELAADHNAVQRHIRHAGKHEHVVHDQQRNGDGIVQRDLLALCVYAELLRRGTRCAGGSPSKLAGGSLSKLAGNCAYPKSLSRTGASSSEGARDHPCGKVGGGFSRNLVQATTAGRAPLTELM